MKARSERHGSAQPERCAIRAAMHELSVEPSLKAVSFDRATGKLSVATFGWESNKAIGDRIAADLLEAPPAQGGEDCKLLQAGSNCDDCPRLLEMTGEKGYTIELSGDSTTWRASLVLRRHGYGVGGIFQCLNWLPVALQSPRRQRQDGQ